MGYQNKEVVKELSDHDCRRYAKSLYGDPDDADKYCTYPILKGITCGRKVRPEDVEFVK